MWVYFSSIPVKSSQVNWTRAIVRIHGIVILLKGLALLQFAYICVAICCWVYRPHQDTQHLL